MNASFSLRSWTIGDKGIIQNCEVDSLNDSDVYKKSLILILVSINLSNRVYYYGLYYGSYDNKCKWPRCGKSLLEIYSCYACIK